MLTRLTAVALTAALLLTGCGGGMPTQEQLDQALLTVDGEGVPGGWEANNEVDVSDTAAFGGHCDVQATLDGADPDITASRSFIPKDQRDAAAIQQHIFVYAGRAADVFTQVTEQVDGCDPDFPLSDVIDFQISEVQTTTIGHQTRAWHLRGQPITEGFDPDSMDQMDAVWVDAHVEQVSVIWRAEDVVEVMTYFRVTMGDAAAPTGDDPLGIVTRAAEAAADQLP